MYSEKDLVEKIRIILLDDWDPIQIGTNPHLRDEYDIYIADIIKLLEKNADIYQLMSLLDEIENEYIGTSTNDGIRHKVSVKLKACVE
jgi:hypothetical protein